MMIFFMNMVTILIGSHILVHNFLLLLNNKIQINYIFRDDPLYKNEISDIYKNMLTEIYHYYMNKKFKCYYIKAIVMPARLYICTKNDMVSKVIDIKDLKDEVLRDEWY